MEGNDTDEMAIFGNDGDRHSRLKLLFLQLRKVAETRVVQRSFFKNYRLEMHSNPAGNSLSQSHFNFTHKILILLICACKCKALFIFIIEVKECSLAGYSTEDNIYQVPQNFIKFES